MPEKDTPLWHEGKEDTEVVLETNRIIFRGSVLKLWADSVVKLAPNVSPQLSSRIDHQADIQIVKIPWSPL